MSFLRHARSIGPMWEKVKVKTIRSLDRYTASRWSAPRISTGTRLRPRPCSSSAMSTHRLSLGGLLSSRARLRFAGCIQFAMKKSCRSRSFHRTANSVLTVCLSPGDHRTSRPVGFNRALVKEEDFVDYRLTGRESPTSTIGGQDPNRVTCVSIAGILRRSLN